MKRLKKFLTGFFVTTLVFTFFTTNTSAAYIPLEGGMSPQHYSAKGTQLIDFQKKLTWYDSDSVRYYVTYRDGYGEYHYQSRAFTSFSAYTIPTDYYLGSRTTITWTDYFSVSGIHNSVSMNGSIKLTR